MPYLNLLLLYLLLSSPVCLIEYIYLLNNRSHRIFQYGIYTFSLQLILVLTPAVLGKELIWSIYGLLAITAVRWIWLIILLRRYTEMKISAKFMKEHLYLGLPLILTTLISGSAQYTDGVIVSAVYRDPGMFAWFRYGAKEFPLVLMLANGLSNAMLPEFSTRTQDEGIACQRSGPSQKTLCMFAFLQQCYNAFRQMVVPQDVHSRIPEKR